MSLRIVVIAALLIALPGVCAAFSPKTTTPGARTLVDQYSNSSAGVEATLWHVPASGYDDPFIVFNVTARDHYGVGLAYGALLANQTVDNFEALLAHEAPQWWERALLQLFMQWQYNKYAQPHLPADFQEEMAGLGDGAAGVGVPEAETYAQVGVALSSIATGDVAKDIIYLLKSELLPGVSDVKKALLAEGVSLEEAAARVGGSRLLQVGKTCSFFGVWGDRTQQGQLFSGRNLDWAAQTGVARYKTINVYHIGESHSYASVSFAGLVGAITGMSAAGITVHEAGDDNTLETLDGFAWSLRLRALMERASNLAEAKAFWEATNNTLGINHGIGSSSDPGFLALETRAAYTAYFEDDDAREAALEVNGTHYGFPMEHAVWRTNHGYDPTFLTTAMGGQVPGHDSFTRYMLLHDTFEMYGESGSIGALQAVNLTAVVGDKGGSSRSSFVTCDGPESSMGENIVSATFQPGAHVMYVAYENGANATHVPACCNNYVQMDMKPWFFGDA